jgi:acetyl-CoA carboxylase biotin carboxyl carrier protein
MDLRKLKTLIDLVSESQISELEITEAEGKVRIVRGGVAPLAHSYASSSAPVVSAAPNAAMPAASASAIATSSAAASAEPVPSGNIIKSPMVGTFYFSSSPGAKPFVEIGQAVKAGDTVCIIEAMKILNEIESEFEGTIKRCLVTNGQAVEFGQPLFEIE